METSILVAQIAGVAYLALGLGMLLDPGYYKKAFDSMVKDPSYILFGGMMALVIGFLIVNVHNVWVQDWPVIVTLIGWIALVKGVLLLLMPKVFVGFSKGFVKHTSVLAFPVLVLGGIFAYYGFFM